MITRRQFSLMVGVATLATSHAASKFAELSMLSGDGRVGIFDSTSRKTRQTRYRRYELA